MGGPLARAEQWLEDRGGHLLFHVESVTTDLYVLQLPQGSDDALVRSALAIFEEAHACRHASDVLIAVLDDYEAAVHFGRTMVGSITDVTPDHVDVVPHWIGSYSSSEWVLDRPRGPRAWVRPSGQDTANRQDTVIDAGCSGGW
jgi:hypothetical protein